MTTKASDIERRIAGLSDLPTLPEVVKRIGTMVEDRNVNAADLGQLIAKDQVLSAKILRLVNSPIYGFPGRISSISHALVLLGFNAVKGLVLGTTVFESFAKDRREMWSHSIGCAILSKHLARVSGYEDPEEAMVAGLLHDLGKAVLCYVAADEFDTAVNVAKKQRCHIREAEEDLIGVDHTHAALDFIQRWNLPDRLRDAIEHHHRPRRAREGKRLTAVVHVADVLARAMGYGYAGDDLVPEIDAEAFKLLNLTWEQVGEVIAEADTEFEPTLELFSPIE